MSSFGLTSFLALLQNENMKIYNRVRTWVMLVLLVVSIIITGLLFKFVIGANMTHVLQFMALSGFLSSLVTIFTVIVAGDIVASEFTWGTIKLLLIRPASRSKILAAKYAAVLLFLIMMLALQFIASYFTGLLLFGAGEQLELPVSLGSILRTYGLDAVSILMTVTVAFMISAAFRSSSLAIGLSIFLMLTKDGVVMALAQLKYAWVKYFLFANTDLTPYFIGGKPLMAGMTLGFSVTVLIVYWIVLYAISWLLFTKRDVAGV